MTTNRPAQVLLVDSLGYEDLGGASTVVNELINRMDRACFVPTLATLGPGGGGPTSSAPPAPPPTASRASVCDRRGTWRTSSWRWRA